MKLEQNAASEERSTRTTVDRFNQAFNLHDVDALAALLPCYLLRLCFSAPSECRKGDADNPLNTWFCL